MPGTSLTADNIALIGDLGPFRHFKRVATNIAATTPKRDEEAANQALGDAMRRFEAEYKRQYPESFDRDAVFDAGAEILDEKFKKEG